MNWRTTAVLFVILLLLGGYVYYQGQQEPEVPTSTPAPPAPEQIVLFPDISVDQVVRLDVIRHEDGFTASFSRDDADAWTRTVPTTTQVISQTMETYITGLTNLTSSRSLSPEANPLSAYGLDSPAYELTFAARQGDGQIGRSSLIIGQETPTGNNYYGQKKGNPLIYVLPKGPIDTVITLLDEPPILQPTPEPGG